MGGGRMEEHNGLDPPVPKAESGKTGKSRSQSVWIYLYTGIASFMSFTFGYNAAIIAAVILFIPKITFGEISALVSLTLLGAFCGSLSGGPLADWTGRKPALLLNYLFAFSASLGSALSMSTWQLILWRFILGFGIGVASVLVPLYIAEMGPMSKRGVLSTGNQLAGSLGMVFAYFVGAAIVASRSKDCWRWMFASGLLLSIIGFILTYFIPESPQWLLINITNSNDKNSSSKKEALKVLEKIHGNEQEYRWRFDQQSRNKSITGRWRDLGRRQYRRPLLISCLLLPFLQAFSGNTTLVYYTALLLLNNYSKVNIVMQGKAVLYMALTGLPQPIVLLAVLYLLDRLGRKLLLLLSIVGTCISSLSLGLLFFFSPNSNAIIVGDNWVSLILIIALFRIFYALGLGPMPQVLGSEVLPFPVRVQGTAISLGVYWLTVAIITAAFPFLLRSLPAYVIYWFFAAALLLSSLLVLHFVQEGTETMEEIECMHYLPVIAPDGSNRGELPKDSMASKLRPVTIILPSNVHA